MATAGLMSTRKTHRPVQTAEEILPSKAECLIHLRPLYAGQEPSAAGVARPVGPTRRRTSKLCQTGTSTALRVHLPRTKSEVAATESRPARWSNLTNSSTNRPPLSGSRRISIGWKADALRFPRPKAQEAVGSSWTGDHRRPLVFVRLLSQGLTLEQPLLIPLATNLMDGSSLADFGAGGGGCTARGLELPPPPRPVPRAVRDLGPGPASLLGAFDPGAVTGRSARAAVPGRLIGTASMVFLSFRDLMSSESSPAVLAFGSALSCCGADNTT